MSEEKEVFWLVRILGSEFKIKSFGSYKAGYKRDFEVIAKASENNKEFRKFLNRLIEECILEVYESKKMVGKDVCSYVVNFKKGMKMLNQNPAWAEPKKIAIEDFTSF